MILLDAWQQTPYFEPDNPGQQVQEHYTGLPGGYSSFYWNRIPLKVETLDGSVGAPLISSGTKSLFTVMIALAAAVFVYNKTHAFKHRKKKAS